MAGDELNSDDDSDEESDDEDDDDDPDNFEDTSESDQQDSKVDSLKSKLYERARAMKQDGQPINLLPRYVHSRQKPLVEQQQQQLPTTRKEDFHCQFAGCTKICKSAGGLTLHVRRMHRVQNNWSSIKSNPRPYFWSKVNEPSILLATISCYNWLFVCVQVLQFRSLFVEERTASNFHFEDLFFAQAQLCKTSHFTSLCSSQSAVFALCLKKPVSFEPS